MGAGSDAILLGAETLRGLYPVETISIVGKICAEVYLFFGVIYNFVEKVNLFLNVSFELMQIETMDLIVPFSELNSEIWHLESFGFFLINIRSIYFLVLILYSLCLDLDLDVDFTSLIQIKVCYLLFVLESHVLLMDAYRSYYSLHTYFLNEAHHSPLLEVLLFGP